MDARVEAKLGFDKVRAAIEARCSTEYAAARVAEEDFCTDAAQIHRRHLRTGRRSSSYSTVTCVLPSGRR